MPTVNEVKNDGSNEPFDKDTPQNVRNYEEEPDEDDEDDSNDDGGVSLV